MFFVLYKFWDGSVLGILTRYEEMTNFLVFQTWVNQGLWKVSRSFSASGVIKL